ncbi:UNVERIFIED_CONTAM: hypothetical protein ITH36_24240, partial [Salmonella enterica subsp. enterica serovar Weltevreden]
MNIIDLIQAYADFLAETIYPMNAISIVPIDESHAETVYDLETIDAIPSYGKFLAECLRTNAKESVKESLKKPRPNNLDDNWFSIPFGR